MRLRPVGSGFQALTAALAATLVVASAPAARAAETETFVPTTIHYPGSTATAARGINNRGDIVGTYNCAAACTNPLTGEVSTAGGHGFLLRDGVYTRIDVPGGSGTVVRGIGVQGTVVGQYNAAGVTHGFAYSDGNYVFPIDVPAELFDNPSSPARHTLAVRISPQGDIVGCFHEGTAQMTTMHGWVVRNGEFTALATPQGQTSRDPDTMNNGIAATGAIVGFYLSDGVSYVADQTGILFTFTLEDDRFTLAWDVNARGDIVGVVGDNPSMTIGVAVNPRGFLRTAHGDELRLAVAGASSTQVFGINDRRQIVGQYTDATGTHGFVYRIGSGTQ